MNSSNEQVKLKKVFYTTVVILCSILLFLYKTYNVTQENRKIPRLIKTKKDLAVRGSILSKDGFKIATSKKVYSATIDTRFLDKNKEDLFIKLFSIYSDIDEKVIKKKLNSQKKKGTLYLSKNISSLNAKNLKLLAYKLIKLKVFRKRKIGSSRILIGLDVFETGENRIYPYNDTLTPIIGYTHKKNINNRLRVIGIKGLEGFYDKKLNNFSDGVLSGEKDIASYIIFNKNSTIKAKKDGINIKLNISLKLQKNIELMLDKMKEKFQANEIIAAVMESSSGKILAFATSNRYNPNKITKKDIKRGLLSVKAAEYPFEPGSVIKPIAISLALNYHKVTLDELFYAYNKGKRNSKGEFPRGKIKVDRFTINDDHRFRKHYITVEDIIVYSSNIGTLQIANRLSADQFYNGYKDFGFGRKSGIDLNRELKGTIRKISQLAVGEDRGKLNVFKSTMSYGQGMSATFVQILKAYSVFNNNGQIVIPKLANTSFTIKPKQIISKESANIIKKILIKVVKKGTGKKAYTDGLEIGGKTGTANIAKYKRKGYQRKYISSFFGFVNDKFGHKYTIGVTIFEPVATGKYWYYYYASNSAVPTFKKIIDILLRFNYLKKG